MLHLLWDGILEWLAPPLSHLLQDGTLETPLPAPCKLESKLWLLLTVTGELRLLLTAAVLGVRARLGILLRSLSKSRKDFSQVKNHK